MLAEVSERRWILGSDSVEQGVAGRAASLLVAMLLVRPVI
jgi:hypothetical protein